MTNSLLRNLPSVDEVLRDPTIAALVERYGVAMVTASVRSSLAQLRGQVTGGDLGNKKLGESIRDIARTVEAHIQSAFSFSLHPVVNATGVILHTNLGRAPLSASAIERLAITASVYCNLEFDEAEGGRGRRDDHVQQSVSRLLQLPENIYDTLVVNNCAAAVMLALNSLADGGEVIVSRGELVEIGGSFRVPEIMAKSGAVLREVGTTNRTRIADYEKAITDKTRLLLRVHRSNFSIEGFTEQPALEELVAFGRTRNIPVMEDLGNGAMFDLRTVGVQNESGVAESIRAGVDLITYSGDKLLGGPQAGLITGKKELVAHCRANPLFRALRADKMNIAALEATLHVYLRGAYDEIPVLRMMRLSAEEIRGRAEAMSKAVGNPPTLLAGVIGGVSVIGGGTAPASTLPTFLVAISHEKLSANELLAHLRRASPPVIARIEDARVLLDLRTVFPEQDAQIVAVLRSISS